jgi:hypothetical protein
VTRRLVIPAVAVAALIAGELAVVLTSTSQHAELRVVGHPEARVFVLLIGWSFIGSGLVAWHRRRTNRFGALMVAVGFAWFAAALTASNHRVLFSIGLVIASLWIGIFLHALLSFPTGRLESWAAGLIVAVYYFDVTVLQLGSVMFADVRRSPDCASCPQNVFLFSDRLSDHARGGTAAMTATRQQHGLQGAAQQALAIFGRGPSSFWILGS